MSDTRNLYQQLQDQQMAQRASLFKKLIEHFGPEVLEVVKSHVIEQAAEQMKAVRLEKRDLGAVMHTLWEQIEPNTLRYVVEEASPTQLRMRVTYCRYAEKMREMGAADIGYAFYCAYDDGFCAGLNPDITFTRTKTLMEGDDHCDHTYELGGE